MLKKRGTRHAVEDLERRVMLNAMPVGPEFRVNTYTPDSQHESSMAMDAGGNFVIAWTSYFQDGSGLGVYAQRYNAAGVPQGVEFRVNTYTTFDQRNASVAMDADGDFVVAWESEVQDGDGGGIYARRYDAAGEPRGSEFRVNTFTTLNQSYPSVAMDSDGRFVIAWESHVQDGSGIGTYAQLYNAFGEPQGSEFGVNTYTTLHQRVQSVAMDGDGDFVIAWDSNGQDGDGYGVFAQRYNALGVPQGSEFRVNTYTTSSQAAASIAMDATGNFLVEWQSFDQDRDTGGVFAKRYDAAGNELPRPPGVPAGAGNEFRVNTYTTRDQGAASVAMDAAGNFIIAWESDRQDGSARGIYGKRYNAAGEELLRPAGAPAGLGNEFRVNTHTTGWQRFPSVAMDGDGDFVIAWRSYEQDGSRYGVYAQRYAVVTAPAVDASNFLFETAPQRLSFVFNQNVGASLDLSDIIVQPLPSGPTINPSAVSFDAATNTATFSFNGVLADANFRATLIASGITSPGGTPMGADHVYDFFFLNGDANHDGTVNLLDFNVLAANFGQSNRNFAQGDFNYDGVVNLEDFNILAGRFGTVLAGASFSASTSLFSQTRLGDADEDDAMDELLA